jgi:hypothetical protein
MFWQQCNEDKVQFNAEFPGRLVYHPNGYGEFSTLVFSIHIPYDEKIAFYREITPGVYDLVKSCNHD